MGDRLCELSRWRILLLLLGAAVVVFASLAGLDLEMAPRAWGLVTGFGAITVALTGSSRRFVLPAILALIITVFGGVSAVVAVPEPPEKAAERAATLDKDQVKASTPAEGFVTVPSPQSFRHAAMVTGLGGLTMLFAALMTALLVDAPGCRRERRAGRLERAGKALVLIGFIGVAGALIRFVSTQYPFEDLFDSFKSFWIGGSWLLILGTFAVPGFALWAQGLAQRSAGWREYRPPTGGAVLFLLLLIPTGQRGFLIALGVMLLAILLGNRVIRLRGAIILGLLGVLFIGLTQAARNEANLSNTITVEGFIDGIKPDKWRDLYGSQVASFNWTALVEENREQLDIPDSFVALLTKPVPRSIYPEKSQGFGSEFTQRGFPAAFEQDISFATPLVSEADYNYGLPGVLLAMALLGTLCVLADARLARRSPSAVEPIVVATIFWFAFLAVRGDSANALVFSAGWIIPLIIFSRAIGLRDDPRIRRLLVDALQVAPKFSGIGRRLAEIGDGLRDDPLDLPLEVRCPRDSVEELRKAFPADTSFSTPLASGRPRLLRILYQHLIAPFRTGASTALLCPGDQAPLWGRSPFIYVIHDVRRLSEPGTASGGEALFYRTVMRSGARRAASIITISRFSQDELTRLLSPDCPVGIVSQQPEDIEPVAEAGLRENPANFLLVGALRSYKGIDTAIQALADVVPESGSKPRLICVGDTEGQAAISEQLHRQAVEVGLDEQVEMTGWISDDDLDRLRRDAAATISPSRYEGYGLSVAESLAAGLPTIASDIPPHREIAGDAALYFTAGDAAALAALMTNVAENPDLRIELSRRALQRHLHLVQRDRPWAVAIAAAVCTLP